MASKITPPSISSTAFDCPYCGAFTTQYWLQTYATIIQQKDRTPTIPSELAKQQIESSKELEAKAKARILKWVKQMQSGQILLEWTNDSLYYHCQVGNLFLSKCYNCEKVAVWVHESLVFPAQRAGAEPNQDLPADVIDDFEEARSILNYSARGAAALLRLAMQKLCVFLGETGKTLDEDIGSLVSKGLSPLVQKSLDVVRVIGNGAVHPGTIDLKDDRDTAIRLLDLVNLIADQMITHPKAVQAMYDRLPEGKRQAIAGRNERALGPGKK